MAHVLPPTIHEGMRVFAGSDEIGKVSEVGDGFFKATRGLLFKHEYLIPFDYVVEAGEGVVDLRVDRDAVERLEAAPAEDSRLEGFLRDESFDSLGTREDPRNDPFYRH